MNQYRLKSIWKNEEMLLKNFIQQLQTKEIYTQPIWRSFYLPSQRKLHRNFIIDLGLPRKKKKKRSTIDQAHFVQLLTALLT